MATFHTGEFEGYGTTDPSLYAKQPAGCLFLGHRWGSWSAWEAVMSLVPMLEVRAEYDPPVHDAPLVAYRYRLCGRCGCEEREGRDGVVETTTDPHGIENRLRRRSGR